MFTKPSISFKSGVITDGASDILSVSILFDIPSKHLKSKFIPPFQFC